MSPNTRLREQMLQVMLQEELNEGQEIYVEPSIDERLNSAFERNFEVRLQKKELVSGGANLGKDLRHLTEEYESKA